MAADGPPAPPAPAPRLARVGAAAALAIGLAAAVAAGAIGAIGAPDASTGDALWLALAAFAGTASVLAAVMAFAGARGVGHDVDDLADRVREMAEREVFDRPLPLPSLDEIGDLARAIEALRVRLASLVGRGRSAREKAEAADRYKDEFLDAV